MDDLAATDQNGDGGLGLVMSVLDDNGGCNSAANSGRWAADANCRGGLRDPKFIALTDS